MRIGIHTSIAGGFDKAVHRLVKLGCNAGQVFSRSPRGGRARVLSPEETENFRSLCREHDINPVVVHIPYVLNPATPDDEMHNYAVDMVREDLKRANLLGAGHLVLHMGSHKGAGARHGLSQVVKALNGAIEGYEGETTLLLENTSGSGGSVGHTMEELKWVLDRLDTDKAGICFDTCHAFAAGYDLSDREKVHETMVELDEIIGLHRVLVVHTNDSVFALDSKKDRHADIGAGHIGDRGLAAVINHPGLAKAAFILETPCETDEDWARNLKHLRSLIDWRTGK